MTFAVVAIVDLRSGALVFGWITTRSAKTSKIATENRTVSSDSVGVEKGWVERVSLQVAVR